jgi:hypothetical protein
MSKPLRKYDSVVLDGIHYVPAERPPLLEDAAKLLAEVYGVLWTEVCYDPTNEHTREFAKPLLDKMAEANKLLGFRQ